MGVVIILFIALVFIVFGLLILLVIGLKAENDDLQFQLDRRHEAYKEESNRHE